MSSLRDNSPSVTDLLWKMRLTICMPVNLVPDHDYHTLTEMIFKIGQLRVGKRR